MRRLSVVGNSGSGKSRLARRAADALGVEYVELDAIFHLPNWQEMDPLQFHDRVAELTKTDGWVIDGNYRAVVTDGPVWERADTVVWLDLARSTVMRQVVGRTLRRGVTRHELWNGNQESLKSILAWNPQENIIRWAWTQHTKYAERYSQAMADARYVQLDFVRLRSHSVAEDWLATLS